MQTIIKWQTSMFSKADAVKCYEEITEIGEEVKPEQVVEKAKDESSELHKCFTWDDAKAADAYRLCEARQVLRQLIVITRPDDEEKEQSASVQFRLMMKNEADHDSGYKQTIVMVQDEDEYRKLLDQAYRELRCFKQKYACLQELSEIIALID